MIEAEGGLSGDSEEYWVPHENVADDMVSFCRRNVEPLFFVSTKSNKLSSFDICLRFKVRGTVFQARTIVEIIAKLFSNVAIVSI